MQTQVGEQGGFNNRSKVVGTYFDANWVLHGFLHEHGHFMSIENPGATDITATGINDRGEIVGTYNGYSRGFTARIIR